MFGFPAMQNSIFLCLTIQKRTHRRFQTIKKLNMKNEKMYYLKMIAGLILLPISLMIYLVDRIILVCLVWMPMEPIQKWFDNTQKMIQTMVRIVAVSIIYSIYKFIEWLV